MLTWLADAVSARIILLQAPAGFGKSTVLDSWASSLSAQGHRVVRVTCDRLNPQPAEFRDAINRAVQNARLGAWEASADFFWISEKRPDAAPPVDLFIDEGSGLLCADSLAMLWDRALCGHARVFIASRRKLTVGLARLRIMGQVAVLPAERIAFDSLELRALFDSYGISIQGEELETVVECTRGWPLAAQLVASTAAQGQTVTHAAAALFRRQEIADFLNEEVLARTDSTGRKFLDAVAILGRLCPSLVNAVTGQQNAHEMLDRLRDEGLFVLPAEAEGWYELHPVFRAVLQEQLDQEPSEVQRQRHLRAHQWLDAHGMFIEAFEHAMRVGDSELAARVLDAHCDDFYLSGFERSILPTTTRLPPEVRGRFPRILLAMSWRMMSEWRFEQAAVLLESAEARLKQMRRGRRGPAELRDLDYEIKHRRIMQHLFEEDFATVDKQGAMLVRDTDQHNPYLVMSIYAAMMYAQREQFQLGSIDRLEAAARERLPSVPSRYVHVIFELMVAPGKLLRGETDAAIALLEAGLLTAIEISAPGSPVGATVALPLSEARYTCNELRAAQTLLDDYLPVATKAGFVDQLISGYLTQARLQQQRRMLDGALATLREAETLAAERGFRRLTTLTFAERLALLSRAGQMEEVVRIAKWQGLRLSSPPGVPRKGTTREENAKALAWVRFAHAAGHNHAALAVSKVWRNFTSAAKAVASVVEWDILRSQLLLATNERTNALRVFLQALAIAAPARRVRPFVDEAVRLMPLFEALPSLTVSSSGQGGFIATVLAAVGQEIDIPAARWVSGPSGEVVATGDLTAREVGILRLVAEGHLNVEIGRRLGLTSGTVKWYLHRIYGKLGCRRRVTAIEQGRRLGLID
jgi:LuxR family transcriptional regulator, maltose regulon positive regulatory protein